MLRDTNNNHRHFPLYHPPPSEPFLTCFARSRDMPPSIPPAPLPYHPSLYVPPKPPFAAL